MTRHRDTLLTAMAEPPGANQRPVTMPVCLSTHFVIDDALNAAMKEGDYRSQFLYTRMGNPTVQALERRLAELHEAPACVATASGMAALSTALIALTKPGDVIVADTHLYGVSVTLLKRYLATMGRDVDFVALDHPDALTHAHAKHGSVAWVLGETISNPLLKVLDIPAIVARARAVGARVMIDNTFAGPLVCSPLAVGADVVVESLSKSFSGHGEAHGGAVLGAEADLQLIWEAMIHLGGCLDPDAAYRIWRGSRSLHLRVERASENVRILRDALETCRDVEVIYGRRDSPETLPAWMHTGGTMLAFVLRGGDERALRWLEHLRVIVPATSLGSIESLASLPFNTSHRDPDARAASGILPGTVRLSVGCEHVQDLIDDIMQALDATCPGKSSDADDEA